MISKLFQWLFKTQHMFPWLWLTITLSCTCFSALFLTDLRLDTNITRLLPESSPVSQWTRSLREPVGDGGYFTILIGSEDRENLLAAASYINTQANNLSSVAFSYYRYPIEFINKYKYSLLSLPALDRLYNEIVRLESESNPFSTNLIEETDSPSTGKTERNRQRSLEKSLDQFSSLTEFHESPEGDLLGVFISPKSMITELEPLRKLYNKLEAISQETSKRYQVWSEVGGSQIRNLREYKSILEDLGRAGIISLSAIFIVLLFSFRSLRMIPIAVFPLTMGLSWAFSFVPTWIGPLNIITVFLLLILFGMGIDYAIHLIRNFQQNLLESSAPEALSQTLTTTGKSVIISGLTTALPLFVLALSNFRGFSDFGLIGGVAIIMLLLAMFTVLPSLLIIASQHGLISQRVPFSGSVSPPPRWLATIALVFILLSAAFALFSGNLFDYNFQAHSSDIVSARNFDRQHRKVYNRSMVPAALYLAKDLDTLDQSVEIFNARIEEKDSTIERVASIRDFAPTPEIFQKKQILIQDAKEVLAGSWSKQINDVNVKKRIESFRLWDPPVEAAKLAELPPEITSYYMARDSSEQFILGVYPAVSRRNGHEVLAFHDELKQISLPDQLLGPVGEVVIFAEILELVLHETPIITFFALLSVAIPVYISSRSFRETGLTLFPLITGLLLLSGIMLFFGVQLNYLSIVIIPALLGLGVDDGVHYFRYCKAHNFDVITTQKDLFGTLSVCTLTTMIGYFGLVVAHNQGLRSLGVLACLGMACLWVTSVFLLPAFLAPKHSRKK